MREEDQKNCLEDETFVATVGGRNLRRSKAGCVMLEKQTRQVPVHWCGAAAVQHGTGGQTRSCQARAKKLGSIPRRAWTAAANLFTQISAFLYWNTIGRSSVGDLRIRTWGCRESRLGWKVPKREREGGGGQQ